MTTPNLPADDANEAADSRASADGPAADGVSSDETGFWSQLGEKHRQDLDAYGYDAIKRNQAFRYFNWRWSWSSIRRSEQMRFLLRNCSPIEIVRCALTPAPLSDEAWADVRWPSAGHGSDTDASGSLERIAGQPVGRLWPRRDRWLYAFAVRLLWQYAGLNDPTGVTALPEPEIGRPLPISWRGRIISQDLANSALEVAAISRALAGRRPGNILELGAGYGRTAYSLLSVFPEATYTIVDIEPAISISRWYLSQLFAPERLRFVSPEDAEALATGSVDLALTISSLQEMSTPDVGRYLRLFDRLADGGVAYLKQWKTWTNPVDRVVQTFDEYPIPGRWLQLFKERAPVQTAFVQAAWEVPQG